MLDRALAVLAQNGGPPAGDSLGAQLYLNKANALGRRGQHPEALVRHTITAGIWAVFFSKSSSDDRTIVAGISAAFFKDRVFQKIRSEKSCGQAAARRACKASRRLLLAYAAGGGAGEDSVDSLRMQWAGLAEMFAVRLNSPFRP